MVRWELDPDKSAKENLWFVIDKFATVMLRMKNLKFTDDEFNDLLADVRMAAYVQFMSKLHAGKYNRKYNFFQNVHSSVWSVAGSIVDSHMQKIRRKIEMLSYDDVQHTDVLLAGENVRASRLKGSPEHLMIYSKRDLDYEDYCGCCAEFDIDPMTHEEYLARQAAGRTLDADGVRVVRNGIRTSS